METDLIRCWHRALSTKSKSKKRNDSKNISNKKDCKRKIKSIFKLLIGIEMDGTVKS